MRNGKILNLYKKLKNKYGRPQGQWSLWCKRPCPHCYAHAKRCRRAKTLREKEQVIIEAILTQRTNWRNVELVIANFKKASIHSLKDILKKRNRLASLMRPSGFYRQKSGYLLGLAKFITENGSIKEISRWPLSDLRSALLRIKGVGPETADSILLYALEKPVFVIDEYTRRLLNTKHVSRETSYENLRRLFEENLPRNWRLYQDFHALIVIDGKKR